MDRRKKVEDSLSQVALHAGIITEQLKYLRNPPDSVVSFSGFMRTLMRTTTNIIKTDGYHDQETKEFAAGLVRDIVKAKSIAAAISTAESRIVKPRKHPALKELQKISRSLDLLKKKTERSGRKFFAPRLTYARAEARVIRSITNFMNNNSGESLISWITESKRYLVFSEIVGTVRHRLLNYNATISDLRDYFLLHFANGQSPPKGGGKYTPHQPAKRNRRRSGTSSASGSKSDTVH